MKYFTFGFGHRLADGTPLRDRYMILPNREEMYRICGRCWSHEYDTPEAAGVEKFGLVEITESEILAGGGTRPAE